MYSTIEITSFKSIKQATVRLPSFGAIVGRNAAGKTNLIQAIKFVRDLAVGKTTADAQKSISLIPNELFNFNEGKHEFGINLTIKFRDETYYLLCLKIGLINGTVKPGTLFVSEEQLYKLSNNNSEKEEIYSRDKDTLKDKNNQLIPVSVDNNKLALSVYKNQYTDLVKNAFVKTVIPDIEHVSNLDSIAIGSVDAEFENLASVIISLHHNRPQDYENFQIIIKKLLPHFSSIIEIAPQNVEVSSPEKESYLVVLEESNLKQQLSMQSVSSGDLKTLLLIAITLNMEDYSTLIIEEIENGMHPRRIVDLIEHLDTISKVKKMQILFTTHSPVVINRLSSHEVVLTHRDTDLGTEFKLLEESEEIGRIKKYLQEGGILTDYLYTNKY